MKIPSFVSHPKPDIFLGSNYLVLDVENTNNQKGWAIVPNKLLYTYIQGPKIASQGIEVIGGVLELSKYVEMLLEVDFIVAHNAKHELQWLHKAGMDISRILVYDTMLGDYCLSGNRRWKLSLEEMSKRYKGPEKNKYIANLMKEGVCPSIMPESMLYDRCKLDVAMTENIFLKQRQILNNKKLLPIMYTKCLFTPVLADIEINGMFLDKKTVEEIHKNLTNEWIELDYKLKKLTGGINMASPKQIGEYLYDELKFKELTRRGIVLRSPAGNRLTNAETISNLKTTTKKQKKFIEFKQKESKIRKKISTYTSLYMKSCKENEGHVHGRINQSVTTTHRLSSSNPNMQNQDRSLKKVFTSRYTGWQIVQADYSQLEYVVAGFLAQCPIVLEDKQKGVDAHELTAEIIYGETFKRAGREEKKRIRTKSKPSTFKPLYGGMSGTKKEQEYYKFFIEKHTGIKKWHNLLCEEGIKFQSIRTITGLIFYFPGTSYTNNGYLQNQTSIKNYPVQYFATGEIAVIGTILVWHKLKAQNMKSLLVNEVHDSVILESPKEEINQIKQILNKEMVENTIKYLDKVYKINYNYPLEIEIETGENWK